MSKDTPKPEYVRGLENLTPSEASVYTRYSESRLAKFRHYGGGPTYLKLSARKVVYRRADLDAWMATRAFVSTSAEAAGMVAGVAA